MARVTHIETDILAKLRASGAEILTDAPTLDLFAHDIYARGADLCAVVRPTDKQQLAMAVATATAHDISVIPRGGGMSYTGGYTAPEAGAILFDLAAMDHILDINESDMTVTVQPGCTWAALYAALEPKGLRTAFWGTLSGLRATVGGGMSQNGVFWGSGRHGTAVESCKSLEIILADGTIMRTGSDFMRSYGPDLTGLFLADSGALGMKAEITLRLVREAEAHGYANFTFETHADVLDAMAEVERAGIATECFGFDPNLNSIRMERDSLAADAKALGNMMKQQGGILKALKEGAKVVTAGRSFLKDAKFSLHILSEGRVQAAADDDIDRAQAIALRHNGTETENTIPKIIRASPFGPLNSVLGPDGERWAPIHGLVPHSKGVAIVALFDAHREEMNALGVFTGTLIEPCLYWPDVANPAHENTMESDHFAKLPRLEANAEAWALVQKLKQGLIDLFYEQGVAHFQIARTYRYRDSLNPAADALLRAVKRQVDPRGLMNPGSLGLT